jgi:hypothetical protein
MMNKKYILPLEREAQMTFWQKFRHWENDENSSSEFSVFSRLSFLHKLFFRILQPISLSLAIISGVIILVAAPFLFWVKKMDEPELPFSEFCSHLFSENWKPKKK